MGSFLFLGQAHPSLHRRKFACSARCERPRRRLAGEERDELAALDCCNHSITSSAATSKPGGTVKSNAFAVLRLRIVWYLVGACTGSSAGELPRKMRST